MDPCTSTRQVPASFPGMPAYLTWVSPSRLEKTCVDLLQTTLCLPTSPEQLQVLCAAILREMSPFNDLALSCDHTPNTRQLSLVASVLLAQVMQLPLLGVG